MALTTCVGSFYLSFLLAMLLKDGLIFVSLKYSDGKLEDMFKLMVMFDFIVFFTLPLLMMLGGGVC